MAEEVYVAVIGASAADEKTGAMARELGALLAQKGYTLVTGGIGGVMRAASEGARQAGGHTVGLLPGLERGQANEFVEYPVVTGLGHMRNFLVVANADIIIAVEGGWGTLSELALARKIGKPVIAVGRWGALDGVIPAMDPAEAVALADRALGTATA